MIKPVGKPATTILLSLRTFQTIVQTHHSIIKHVSTRSSRRAIRLRSIGSHGDGPLGFRAHQLLQPIPSTTSVLLSIIIIIETNRSPFISHRPLAHPQQRQLIILFSAGPHDQLYLGRRPRHVQGLPKYLSHLLRQDPQSGPRTAREQAVGRRELWRVISSMPCSVWACRRCSSRVNSIRRIGLIRVASKSWSRKGASGES